MVIRVFIPIQINFENANVIKFVDHFTKLTHGSVSNFFRSFLHSIQNLFHHCLFRFYSKMKHLSKFIPNYDQI